MEDELDGIAVFVAVAEEKGFRAAARRLGVSGSAVSQALAALESRLGAALAYRTTRSVRLTEAGERLYRVARPALDEVRSAIADLKELGSEPSGTLRLAVSSAADTFLSGTLLAGFLTTYPRVRLDLTVSEHPSEIVANGFDAGVGLGQTLDQDMVGLQVSEQLRLVVVGAPSYFANHPAPRHPRELANHVCINWRPAAGGNAYRWEFTEKGREFWVTLDARVATNDPALNIRFARRGVGLTMAWETWVRADIERGDLVEVLQDYCAPFPGFYLYYPRRRHSPPALRALTEYVRDLKTEPKAKAKRSR